jgi:hypothetical protein
MITAIGSPYGPAHYLHANTTAETARKAMEAGKVTPDDVYVWATTNVLDWDRHLIELADALPGTEMHDGVFFAQQRLLQTTDVVHVTTGKTGRVILRGVTGGNGVPPNFTPRQLADVFEYGVRLIDHVIELADKRQPPMTTRKVKAWGRRRRNGLDMQTEDPPRSRAGAWVLAWESEEERRSTLKRLRYVRSKLIG